MKKSIIVLKVFTVLISASAFLLIPVHKAVTESESSEKSLITKVKPNAFERILLKIGQPNPWGDNKNAISWGDLSTYKRYVTHFNIAEEADRGGINLSKDRAFVAVNDQFLEGLEEFKISFWFIPREDHPKGLNTNGNGGMLISSNWADYNDGDWYIGFNSYGGLTFGTTYRGIGRDIIQSTETPIEFLKNKTYYVSLLKTKEKIQLFLNDTLIGEILFEHKWPGNEVPLAIGGNPYDREGFGFFNGVIGNLIITDTPSMSSK